MKFFKGQKVLIVRAISPTPAKWAYTIGRIGIIESVCPGRDYPYTIRIDGRDVFFQNEELVSLEFDQNIMREEIQKGANHSV